MSLSAQQVDFLKQSIASILHNSDLDTVSTKSVRTQLADLVDYDILPFKREINTLILDQFDLLAQDDDKAGDHGEDQSSSESRSSLKREAPESGPDGHDLDDGSSHAPEPRKKQKHTHHQDGPKPTKAKAKRASSSTTTTTSSSSASSQSSATSASTHAAQPASGSTKKSSKLSTEETDALLAARLQAEENSRVSRVRQARSDKKKPKPRKKASSSAAAKAADEDGNSDGTKEKKSAPRSNVGFHKPMVLSPALSDLLGGTKMLSRPQTVKMIWEYIRLNNLQDESDKRQIRCDNAMRAVFKTDKVHMFTMNKLLTNNLFPIEEEA